MPCRSRVIKNGDQGEGTGSNSSGNDQAPAWHPLAAVGRDGDGYAYSHDCDQTWDHAVDVARSRTDRGSDARGDGRHNPTLAGLT
jgi:hypothetical protein